MGLPVYWQVSVSSAEVGEVYVLCGDLDLIFTEAEFYQTACL